MGLGHNWGGTRRSVVVAGVPSARRGAAEGGQPNLVPFLELRAVNF